MMLIIIIIFFYHFLFLNESILHVLVFVYLENSIAAFNIHRVWAYFVEIIVDCTIIPYIAYSNI